MGAGITNANACIATTPRADDPYLTNASVAFHERMGYRLVGTFHQVGYKFGSWYDMVWMEKAIGAHLAAQPPVVPFPEIPLPGEPLSAPELSEVDAHE